MKEERKQYNDFTKSILTKNCEWINYPRNRSSHSRQAPRTLHA